MDTGSGSVCIVALVLLIVLATTATALVRSAGLDGHHNGAPLRREDNIYDGPWRKAIAGTNGTCWTERSCNRALTVSHGGDWDLQFPYDSLPAFQRAAQMGADAVKGDFRVAKDNIGMVMHSSPVEVLKILYFN